MAYKRLESSGSKLKSYQYKFYWGILTKSVSQLLDGITKPKITKNLFHACHMNSAKFLTLLWETVCNLLSQQPKRMINYMKILERIVNKNKFSTKQRF